jgi:hypothetical protein
MLVQPRDESLYDDSQPLRRHAEGTLQAILRQAGIDPDQFLERK